MLFQYKAAINTQGLHMLNIFILKASSVEQCFSLLHIAPQDSVTD